MKKVILGFLVALTLIGCSSSATQNLEPKLVVGKTLSPIRLNNQFGEAQSISADTYRIIFAFDKEPAHICNDFFNTQKASYLQEHHTAFIADVSAAPSIIRSLFIMPGLKDFKHQVLLFEEEDIALPYREGVDTTKISVVYIINNKIQEIRQIQTAEELRKVLEDDSPLSLAAPLMNQILDRSKNLLK